MFYLRYLERFLRARFKKKLQLFFYKLLFIKTITHLLNILIFIFHWQIYYLVEISTKQPLVRKKYGLIILQRYSLTPTYQEGYVLRRFKNVSCCLRSQAYRCLPNATRTRRSPYRRAVCRFPKVYNFYMEAENKRTEAEQVAYASMNLHFT